MMPRCPDCGAAMLTVMQQRRGTVKRRYECPSCKREDGDAQARGPERSQRSGVEHMMFEPEVSVIRGPASTCRSG